MSSVNIKIKPGDTVTYWPSDRDLKDYHCKVVSLDYEKITIVADGQLVETSWELIGLPEGKVKPSIRAEREAATDATYTPTGEAFNGMSLECPQVSYHL